MLSARMFEEIYEAPGFTIVKELGDGKGNTARVFLANSPVGESVAIKFYNPRQVDENQKQQTSEPERFVKEFLAAQNITHPNVVKVYACGNLPTDFTNLTRPPFMVMELLTGGDLRKRMRPREPMASAALPATVTLLRKIADGLVAVHSANVVHRDIKPDNIMFVGDEPKVADFGFAKLFDEIVLKAHAVAQIRRTEVGERLGTMAYASPEQIAAAPFVNHKADIFSFGAMTYELLTGDVPFPMEDSDNMDSFLRRRLRPDRLEADALDLALPFGLRSLCVRCLLYEPLERPTARGLASQLRAIESTLTS